MFRGIEFPGPEMNSHRRAIAVVPLDMRDPGVARENRVSPGIYAFVGPVRPEGADEDLKPILDCAGEALASFISSEMPIADAGGSRPISELGFGLAAMGFNEDKTKLLVKIVF